MIESTSFYHNYIVSFFKRFVAFVVNLIFLLTISLIAKYLQLMDVSNSLLDGYVSSWHVAKM